MRPKGSCLGGWLSILLLMVPVGAASGAPTFVSVGKSARQLAVLEGPTRTLDSHDGDLTTFVADCEEYRELPCDCEHVQFKSTEGKFIPGWTRLWHLPTLQRLLTVQQMLRHEPQVVRHLGPMYWHCTGFGNFKNSLDVGFLLATSFGSYFQEECRSDERCLLSQSLSLLLDWLITLKQFSLYPTSGDVEQMRQRVESMGASYLTGTWAAAPWALLLEEPTWAEAFFYMLDELEFFFALAPNRLAKVRGENYLEKLLARLHVGPDQGSARRCSGLWISRAGAAGRSREATLTLLLRAAFAPDCQLHPVAQLILFGSAVREHLHNHRPEVYWPPPTAVGRLLPGPWIFRFGTVGGVVHRRVGNHELHFLAVDVIRVGRQVHLDLLWFATSDDGCQMAGTTAHNQGSSYYSFAHTLPMSHLVHWTCSIRVPGWPEAGSASAASDTSAVTVSFSGFLSITTCLLPDAVAAVALGNNSHRGALGLEVSLRAVSMPSWTPEPLLAFAYPKPSHRRVLSACTTTLHRADYIHALTPHALEDWINYHVLMGVQHFTLFDTDGSYAPYVKRFVAEGIVDYRPRFPQQVAPKLGLLTAGLSDWRQQRPMLLEPHALDVCVWHNRQVSDWVVLVHSFEEYIHMPTAWGLGDFPLRKAIRAWASHAPGTKIFELFQEPMGGPKIATARSVLSTWVRKRDLKIEGPTLQEQIEATHMHFQPFAWIVDPLNTLQTAVHFAQARAEGSSIGVMPKETIRVNHYVDFGSNTSRCEVELGGCNVPDSSILWAEEAVLQMRGPRIVQST